MPSRLILIIEDDAALRATLVEQLAMEGDSPRMKRRAWPKQTPSYPGPMHATMPSCSISACRTATVAISAPSSVAMVRRSRSSC